MRPPLLSQSSFRTGFACYVVSRFALREWPAGYCVEPSTCVGVNARTVLLGLKRFVFLAGYVYWCWSWYLLLLCCPMEEFIWDDSHRSFDPNNAVHALVYKRLGFFREALLSIGKFQYFISHWRLFFYSNSVFRLHIVASGRKTANVCSSTQLIVHSCFLKTYHSKQERNRLFLPAVLIQSFHIAFKVLVISLLRTLILCCRWRRNILQCISRWL